MRPRPDTPPSNPQPTISLTPTKNYVLYTFMSAERPAVEPTPTPGPQNQGKNRCGPLITLVRRIIDHGRDLIAALQRQNTPTPSTPLARRFGSFDLALIIARITRGLLLATALESRLLRAPPARPRPPRPPSQSARPRAPQPQAQPDSDLLANMPSAEAIAAQIRHRSAGAVIVDICRDLGIDTTHPLWPAIRDAIIGHNGSLARMVTFWIDRLAVLLTPTASATAAPSWAHGTTGPP